MEDVFGQKHSSNSCCLRNDLKDRQQRRTGTNQEAGVLSENSLVWQAQVARGVRWLSGEGVGLLI